MTTNNFGINGLSFAGMSPPEPPILLVMGPEKVGKCLRGNTLCLDPHAGRLVRLDTLVQQLKTDGRVLTMNAAGLLVETRPTRFAENPPEQLFRLRTQTGFEIEATATHPFLTQTGWKALKDLDLTTDRVVTVAEYPREIFWNGSRKDDPNWIKILAYLIADGSLGGSSPVFTKNEAVVREDFVSAVESFGDAVSLYENNGVMHVRVRGADGKENRVLKALRDLGLGGAISREKTIPDFVFGMSRQNVALFLSRLFTCDGSVEASEKISYSSTSLTLIRQVRHLLARFGIVGAVREKFLNGALYGAEIAISSRAQVIKFVDEIKLIGEKGEKAQAVRDHLATLSTVDGVETQLWRQGPYLFDRIEVIEPTVVEATFDIEIPDSHNFIANDFVVHNSTLTTTLYDWPAKGKMPLVLAYDAAGVDSCAQFGFNVPHIKIKDQPGNSFYEKSLNAIANLKQVFAAGRQRADFPFSTVVVDCASTMTDRFYEEATIAKKGVKLQAYGDVLDFSKRVMWSLLELGVPTIWYSWLKDAFVDESGEGPQKRRKTVMGGPLITGNFKATLAGKATQMLLLEKQNVGTGQPGTDAQGYRRVLHTRTYNNVECAGRYSQFLPEPCEPNLAYILHQIMTMGGQRP